jgi:hypothetical protein
VTRKGFETLMRAAGKAASRLAKDHAPDIGSKTPLIMMLDPIELSALDAWITGQPEPKPTRPEAIRRLLAEALVQK